MATRTPLAIGEWYHCYNRGVDKRKVFNSKYDYERFLLLMYIGNSDISIHVSNMKDRRLTNVLEEIETKRGKPLVEIGAYALMPNHFHFILKEIRDGGISLFMQKVFTGYTMYYNKKNDRTGALFAGTFKSRHIADDRYLKHLISYIHMNPAELFDPNWMQKRDGTEEMEKFLSKYQYSSLLDFNDANRAEKLILSQSIFDLFDRIPSLKKMLHDARAYNSLQI